MYDLHQLPRPVQILHLAASETPRCGVAPIDLGPRQSNPPIWTHACSHTSRRSKKMLWTIFVVLLVLWALGMATSYTASGLIHILLVIAVAVLIFRLIQGRRILG
jgi:hypothetical protein